MLPALVFVLSAFAIIYVLFGYPLLLGLLAKLRRRPVVTGAVDATVSILLPVRDGERWIAAKLDSILALDYPRDRVQVVVVSDGSTDLTDRIVMGYQGRGVELVRGERLGKPAALNLGMTRCRGDLIVFTDVRQALAPNSLERLVEHFADSSVGVVSGELVIRNGGSCEEADTGLYWRYEKWIRQQLSSLDSVPGATGCFYAMRRELVRPLPPEALVDDMYLPLTAFLDGYRVLLVDAKAYDEPTTLSVEFRRKVRTLAGIYQMIGWFPSLIGPRNRMWLHFISHKLGRLLLPWAMLAAAVSTFWLPPGIALAAGIGQALFYGLAVFDRLVPEAHRLKRLTSPARTFIVLMCAAMCAASILFRDSKQFWSAPTGAKVQRTAA